MKLKAVDHMDERQSLSVLENVGDTDFPAIVDEDGGMVAVLLKGRETTAKKLLGPLTKQLEKEDAARGLPASDPAKPAFQVDERVLFSAGRMRMGHLQVGTVKSIRREAERMVFPMAWYGRSDSITHQDTNVYVLEAETYDHHEAAECELRPAAQDDVADHEKFWRWLRGLRAGDDVGMDTSWHRGGKRARIKTINTSKRTRGGSRPFEVTLMLDDRRGFRCEAFETLVGPEGERGPLI